MDEIIELAKSLKQEIDKLPEMKEYLRLKELLEKDQELKRMRTEIARLQNEGKTKEKENLLALYNSHPLVNNFSIAKEEVTNLLSSISQILQ